MEPTILQNSTIYNADCFDIFHLIPDKSIDAIICDLPFGTTQNKWDSILPLDKLWEQYKRILKPNGVVLLFGAEPFSSYLRISNIKEFKYDWYWEKDKGTNFGSSRKQPLKKIETISVFYNKQPFYDYNGDKLDKPYTHTLPINKSGNYGSFGSMDKVEREYVTYTHKTKKNLIYFSRDNANKGEHPTQKPIDLIEYLVKTYTNEGDTVLDNTMGSGTTGVACVNTGRKFIGIEKEKNYFDIAVKRIKEARHKLFV
jgi:site-specific DNA-methyltransferase (adenine-specific)